MAAIATKTPDEVKSFSINWAPALGNDTVLASSWNISLPGPYVIADEVDANLTTVWLGGGGESRFYEVTNTITTTAGRTLTETFKLEILKYNYL